MTMRNKKDRVFSEEDRNKDLQKTREPEGLHLIFSLLLGLSLFSLILLSSLPLFCSPFLFLHFDLPFCPFFGGSTLSSVLLADCHLLFVTG
ncbi:unnamed protein product [Camellia sinensis]